MSSPLSPRWPNDDPQLRRLQQIVAGMPRYISARPIGAREWHARHSVALRRITGSLEPGETPIAPADPRRRCLVAVNLSYSTATVRPASVQSQSDGGWQLQQYAPLCFDADDYPGLIAEAWVLYTAYGGIYDIAVYDITDTQ